MLGVIGGGFWLWVDEAPPRRNKLHERSGQSRVAIHHTLPTCPKPGPGIAGMPFSRRTIP